MEELYLSLSSELSYLTDRLQYIPVFGLSVMLLSHLALFWLGHSGLPHSLLSHFCFLDDSHLEYRKDRLQSGFNASSSDILLSIDSDDPLNRWVPLSFPAPILERLRHYVCKCTCDGLAHPSYCWPTLPRSTHCLHGPCTTQLLASIS